MRIVAPSMLALAASANAAYQGFNYGNLLPSGAVKTQADYEAEFTTAAGLEGTNGAFTSARLYTMIQGGTVNAPIEAIPAAISTSTSLLLGMWCSAGDAVFENELAALRNAMDQYGEEFASLVAGISVGSEDLYRITPTGIANDENPGVGPDVLARYIGQVRDVIAGTVLSGAKIGHVDTWTAWVNGSNKAVIDAVDWVGMDAYPYFEAEHANGISNGAQLFSEATANTDAATGGKEIWITETGWPVSGETVGQAVPSVENAQKFWNDVGCPMFGSTNVWWYTLQGQAPGSEDPDFGVIGPELTTTPRYDLSCRDVDTEDPATTATANDPDQTEDGEADPTEGSSDGEATPTPSGDSSDSGEGEEDRSDGSDGDSSSSDGLTATDTSGSSTPTSDGSGSGDDTGSDDGGSDSGSGSGLGSDDGDGEGAEDGDGTNDETPTVDTNDGVRLSGRSFSAGVLAIMAAVCAL